MSYTLAEQIGSFWVGDVPLGTTTLTVIDEDDNTVDLTSVTNVQATVYGPDGDDLTGFLTVTHDADELAIHWPSVSVFAAPGIHTLSVKLVTASGAVLVAPSPFVVEERTGWHTLSSAHADWRDAPDNDAQLYTLLSVARTQCEVFAPELELDAPVPTQYRLAQLMQSRNLWNASKVDAGNGSLGGESYVIRPFPMDWVVKGILRPARAVPVLA